MKNQIITVEKQDVFKSIYFIAEMSQNTGDKGMYGGLAGKSDLMGGIFDRWINQIPESVIFNKLILPRISGENAVEVIIDFYKYKPKQETTGIAPDVIGLKINDNIVPFVIYDKKWVPQEGMPQIEVKTFKKPQKMVSLRNQGYDGKYLVMVESDFRTDYLLPFFDASLFTEDVYAKMTMNDEIFLRTENEHIHHLNLVNTERADIGHLKLLCITETSLFTKVANYCGAGVSPIRIDDIVPAKNPRSHLIDENLSDFCELQESGLYRFNERWSTNKETQYLDFYCSDIDGIKVIKRNKTNAYIKSISSCVFNGTNLTAGSIYKIAFTGLDRKGASEGEYFLQKELISEVEEKEQELLTTLENIIQENK